MLTTSESVMVPRYVDLARHFAGIAIPVLFAAPLAAETPLQDVFDACQASVIDGSESRLRDVGTLIDEDDRVSRIRVDTPVGTVMAMYVRPTGTVTACLLWGRHPELEIEFQDQWQDWVEWEEAATASEAWFSGALENPGSYDLTDATQPGFVVARCSEMEHGLVLASQPMIANVLRQVLPKLEPKREPIVHYQFSAVSALPGLCSAAVESHKAQN